MTRITPWLMTLALASLLIFAACDDAGADGDNGQAGANETSTATPAATGTPEPLPEALQRVLDRVAEVRQLDASPALNVEFVERSKVPDLLDSLTTDGDREWYGKVTDLYRLLGHLRNDQDFLDVFRSFGGEAVLGVYSPPHDTLWVVHRDGEAPKIDSLPRGLEETLAHEFVHALQDYHFDLVRADDAFEDNMDISLAWTAVIEGDAVTHERAYTQRYLPLPNGTVVLASAAQLPDVPPSIIRELYFPYMTGAQWIQDTRDAKGTSQIDAWLQAPPPGTAYILHPELLDSGFEPEEVELPDLRDALGKGFERTWSSTFGEFNLRNYLQLQARASTSAAAAAGWAGDRFDLYKGDDGTLAVFRVRFVDDQEAAEFETTYREFLDRAGLDVDEQDGVIYSELRDGDVAALGPRQGTDVVFAVASERAIVSRAMGALLGG